MAYPNLHNEGMHHVKSLFLGGRREEECSLYSPKYAITLKIFLTLSGI